MADLQATGIIIGALITVTATILVLRAIGISFSIDLFGKKSVRLIHTKEKNEIKHWRIKQIDEAERKGKKVLFAKVGAFGNGMLETVKYALNKGFSVTVVSSNITYCKSRDEVIKILTDENYSTRFKYYVLNHRPSDHFAIIGQSNLLIESPMSGMQDIKYSLGIINAHYFILDKFKINFENTIKIAKEVNVDFVKNMPCYGNVN